MVKVTYCQQWEQKNAADGSPTCTRNIFNLMAAFLYISGLITKERVCS